MSGTLFDLAPTPQPEPMSADRRRTRRRREMIAAGVHPVTRQRLLPRERGLTCGGCAHLTSQSRNRTYYKCSMSNITRGAATDVHVREPACRLYAAHEEEK